MAARVLAPRRLVSSLPLAGSLILAYGFVLVTLVRQWAHDPNYAHGFFVLPMAAWLAWRRRDAFIRAPRVPSTLGLIVVAAGAVLYVAGVVAAEFFTTRVSLVVVAAGLVLALEGRERFRTMAFPIAFLLFMVPLPYVFYYRLTFPLQVESSRLAASLLATAGMPLVREGNVIHLESYSLEVVTACSGLRSIMTLGTIGVFLLDAIPLTRGALPVYIALIIPIAVAANVARLVATAGIAAIGGPEAAQSFLHELSGLVVFVTGLAALLMCAKGLQWIGRVHGGRPR